MKRKTIEQLQKEIARLESVNDVISTDLGQVDKLLQNAGFKEGTWDLKQAAEELVLNES